MADIKVEILKYESEHKILFVNLVIANILWLRMPGKYGFDPKSKAPKDVEKTNAWINMGKNIIQTLAQWRLRQDTLEKIPGANVEKINPEVYKDFLKPEKVKYLYDTAQKMLKPGSFQSGIGFIPLLIWGVVAIAGFLTAAYIINQTTTTAQEKEHLLKTTEQTLKDLNIPPDKAADIISSTQQQASENSGLLNSVTGGGFGKIIPIAIIAYLIMNHKSSNKAAA